MLCKIFYFKFFTNFFKTKIKKLKNSYLIFCCNFQSPLQLHDYYSSCAAQPQGTLNLWVMLHLQLKCFSYIFLRLIEKIMQKMLCWAGTQFDRFESLVLVSKTQTKIRSLFEIKLKLKLNWILNLLRTEIGGIRTEILKKGLEPGAS